MHLCGCACSKDSDGAETPSLGEKRVTNVTVGAAQQGQQWTLKDVAKYVESQVF